MTVTKQKVIGAIVVVLSAIAFIAVWGIRDARRGVFESYALWDAANTIISHLESTRHFPRDWDDMMSSFPSPSDTPRSYGSKSTMQQLVEIDFDADPFELALSELSEDSGSPPFHIVWLQSGRKHHWSGSDPNYLILKYLKDGLKPFMNDEQRDLLPVLASERLTYFERRTMDFFRSNRTGEQQAKTIARICLLHQFSRDKIEALIGSGLRPTQNGFFFGIAPSEYMTFRFDDSGEIDSILINGQPVVLKIERDRKSSEKPPI